MLLSVHALSYFSLRTVPASPLSWFPWWREWSKVRRRNRTNLQLEPSNAQPPTESCIRMKTSTRGESSMKIFCCQRELIASTLRVKATCQKGSYHFRISLNFLIVFESSSLSLSLSLSPFLLISSANAVLNMVLAVAKVLTWRSTPWPCQHTTGDSYQQYCTCTRNVLFIETMLLFHI